MAEHTTIAFWMYNTGTNTDYHIAQAEEHFRKLQTTLECEDPNPDMLKLLKRLQYWFDTDETFPSELDQQANDKWVSEITAVINKAEGK